MRWFKRVGRILSMVVLLVIVCTAAWIFWPSVQPSEQELLRLVPKDAMAVFLQRDLQTHWPAFKRSAFFQALKKSSWMPVSADFLNSTKGSLVEEAFFDIAGKRAVCFALPGTGGKDAGSFCLLTPITPRTKWLWLRIWVTQFWKGAGFRIHSGDLEGYPIREVVTRLPPNSHLRFARFDNAAAIAFDWSGDSLSPTIRKFKSKGEDAFGDFGSNQPEALQVGLCRHQAGTANWIMSQPQADTLRLEFSLPKQRTVRLPWDATRGPRTMALIQKLFPDQGVFSVRGRASHWMTAWDNIVTFVGLPTDQFSENLLTRLKYGEHLSHGQFPWSGAGDELACVVAPATTDMLPNWPSVTFALRCWEPHDTQVALEQLLASLSSVTHDRFWVDKDSSAQGLYAVRVQRAGGFETLFYYRYADGLVIVGNSPQALQKCDPAQFEGQTLQTAEPENQFFCKADQLADSLQALVALTSSAGDQSLTPELGAAAEILKTLSEIHLTIHVEQETVKYVLEVKAL